MSDLILMVAARPHPFMMFRTGKSGENCDRVAGRFQVSLKRICSVKFLCISMGNFSSFCVNKLHNQLITGKMAAFVLFLVMVISMAEAKEVITIKNPKLKDYAFGSVVIDVSERRLYYILQGGQAIRYRVAVGKPGFQWFGNTFVQAKRKNPSWIPTARMQAQGAPSYVGPGPRNPLGIRAIYLGWSEYRIHGTNAPRSIGRAASSGCFRMLNKDVADLYERVHIGAPVHVIH